MQAVRINCRIDKDAKRKVINFRRWVNVWNPLQ